MNTASQDGHSHPPNAARRTMADVLTLPDDLRRIVTWMMRRGDVSVAEVAGALAEDEAAVRAALATLAGAGYLRGVETAEQRRYQVQLQSRPARRTGDRDIFKTLEGL